MKFPKILALSLSCILLGCVAEIKGKEFVVYSSKTTTIKYGMTKNDPNPLYSPIIRIKKNDNEFACTGFVIDGMYAVTSAHCNSEKNGHYSSETYRIFNERDEFVTEAHAFGSYHTTDYGLIVGDFKSFEPARIQPHSNRLIPGKVYIACGYPMGQKQLFCPTIKVIGTQVTLVTAYGELYPGMSGGPVIDTENNEIVGINSRMMDRISIIQVSPLIGILGAFDLE